MLTKECPSCGEEVPSSAHRCKHCFHDFSESRSTPTSVLVNAGLIILGTIAIMSVLLTITLGVVTSWAQDTQISVDGSKSEIIFARQYAWGIETETIPFAQVDRIEHHMENNGSFSLYAITKDGSSYLLAKADRTLQGQAEEHGLIIGTEVKIVDNTSGFFKRARDQQGGE